MWKCLNSLKKLSKNNSVTLYWVPGHVVVEGNKEANKLAGVGAKPFCGIGSEDIRMGLLQEETRLRQQWWIDYSHLTNYLVTTTEKIRELHQSQ